MICCSFRSPSIFSSARLFCRSAAVVIRMMLPSHTYVSILEWRMLRNAWSHRTFLKSTLTVPCMSDLIKMFCPAALASVRKATATSASRMTRVTLMVGRAFCFASAPAAPGSSGIFSKRSLTIGDVPMDFLALRFHFSKNGSFLTSFVPAQPKTSTPARTTRTTRTNRASIFLLIPFTAPYPP